MANLIIVKSCIRLGPRRGSKRRLTTNTDAGRQSTEFPDLYSRLLLYIIRTNERGRG